MLLSLTDKGLNAIVSDFRAHNAREKEWAQALSADEQHTLIALLEKLAAHCAPSRRTDGYDRWTYTDRAARSCSRADGCGTLLQPLSAWLMSTGIGCSVQMVLPFRP